MVNHPSTNRAQRRASLFKRRMTLPLYQTGQSYMLQSQQSGTRRLNELDLTAVTGSGTFVVRHSSVIALLSDVLLSNCVCVMCMHVSSAALTDTITVHSNLLGCNVFSFFSFSIDAVNTITSY